MFDSSGWASGILIIGAVFGIVLMRRRSWLRVVRVEVPNRSRRHRAGEGAVMKFFWISWYQPGEDYRPPKWPLPKSFLGYWCSGEYSFGPDKEGSTLCAHVKAKDESAAKSLIAASWPDHGDFRFCEEKAEGWTPGSRFPKPKWATSATATAPGKGE